jgi:16S rRNA (guanine(966)-N(2))-methyltransferase RsmD
MRIISGQLRGRRLKSIDAAGLRPTTDRVRESIFNVLAARLDFDGIRVLDLFAGTGALGIEAISRGAAHCTFVERSGRTASVIRENLTALDIEEQGNVVVEDAMPFLQSCEGGFDLVVADPPYSAAIVDRLLHDLFDRGIVAPEGLFLFEHAAFTHGHSTDRAELLLEKTFGDTAISLYRHFLPS